MKPADRPLTGGGGGAYIALPPRPGGCDLASCFAGVAALDFLFCAEFGAHLSKSIVGPVLAGLWVTSLGL